ncbi:tetratricopeptide repeat-containing sulfotransferase family protein [Luteimonas salinilitoris]|uniref:Sulfotransferase n=1 Tax=Luteimonas salinilitoris TaxID=3237697 RepID=A0ABV4HMR3_9GAMM
MNAAHETSLVYRQAVEALNRREWEAAERLGASILAQASGHAGLHFVVGVAALQRQRMPQAFEHLGKAARLNPKRPDYVAQWARVLATTHAMREAVTAADYAMRLGPQDPMTLDTLGVVFTQANDHRRAVEAFQRAVAVMPEQAGFRFNLATSLTFVGELDAAEREHEACLARAPGFWKAHLALSQLRRQTTERNHVDRLLKLLAGCGDDPAARLYLNLALEKEYSDLGEHEQSFRHLLAGKAAWRATLDYAFERDEEVFAEIIRVSPQPSQAQGCDSGEPVFVMGMPRTGTTLVDRILSSHPSVQSAGELQNFAVALKRASGSTTPPMLDVDTLRCSGALDWKALGERYIASTRPGTGQADRFIDKLPHNFLYAGFIAAALPNASLVCLRRGAMDTCVSNFRQLFALTSPYYDYSFDIVDTARYFALFDRLMSHWRSVMPGRILEIGYEEIVSGQEAATRKLLKHCGLPWDDACLRFQDNAAPVSSASAVQVRSPLYSTSIGRWKRYGQQLDEVRAVLADTDIPLD